MTTPTQPKLLLKVAEVAHILSVSEAEVYALAAGGDLDKSYIGTRRFRIPMASVEAYVAGLPSEAPEPD